MKKLLFIVIVLIVTVGNTFIFCKQKTVKAEKEIEQTILAQIDSFSVICIKLQDAAVNGTSTEADLQQLFLSARQAYKKFEWAAEYFAPEISGMVNGPPVEEIEMQDLRIIKPAGLQVIEGLLFPKYDNSRKQELIAQLTLLQSDCGNYRSFFNIKNIFNPQVFDGVKLEVFRMFYIFILKKMIVKT
jgi:cytochrome c peroxidase